MTDRKTSSVPDAVAAMLEEANRQASIAAGEAPAAEARSSEEDERTTGSNPLASFAPDAPEMARDPETPEDPIVQWCAKLDHSDTDNAARLLSHFGRNLLVVTQTKARAPLWAAWTGRNWDADTGGPRAFAMAQKVGSRIAKEIPLIGPTDAEARVLTAAEGLADKSPDELKASEKATLDLAGKIGERIRKRKDSRLKHGVTSKNKGRIEAMLACSGPHVMRDPDAFNADKLKVAVNGHTLVFRKFVRDEVIHRGDADLEREIEVPDAEMIVRSGHSREDLITQLVPVDYDKDADCPRWRVFMSQMLPVAGVRRMVQVASGLGLVGITVQKLFFHYGAGANGKSVYMETLCRLLGEAAVTLPASSFIGEGASGGQATPDIARLYGRRMLRVKELPEGEELRENFVKEATGGEALSARDLFLGYFDFEPLFTAHMSGNGFPRITGTDEGIWRRMAVVHWPVQVPVEARLPFEEMVARFEPEYPGILNWLIEGVLIYLREGLSIPDEVTAATAEMRFEMDPTAQFCRDCVAADEQGDVRGNALYEAYVRHAEDQAGKHARPISIQRFGRIMKKKYGWRDDRGTIYRVRLHDVPVKPPPNAYPDGYGGV